MPTVVFGAGELVPRVTEYLNKHTEAGLLLKAHFVSQKSTGAEKEQKKKPQDTHNGLEPLYSRSDLDTFVRLYPRTCASVVMEKDAPLACRQELIDLASLLFSSVIIIPEDFSEGEIPFWVRPVEIGDVLCFKVRQNLLDPKRLSLKRAMDCLLYTSDAADERSSVDLVGRRSIKKKTQRDVTVGQISSRMTRSALRQ